MQGEIETDELIAELLKQNKLKETSCKSDFFT